MKSDRLAALDRHVEQLRKRLEVAENIRQALAIDPELIDLLLSEVGASKRPEKGNGKTSPHRKPNGERAVKGGPVAQANFRKIAEYLELKGNEPQPIPVIAKAVGLKNAAVIQICYRTHNAAFESLDVPGHATRKQWRLRKNWKEVVGG